MTRKTSVPRKVIPLRRKKAMSNGNPSKKIVTLGEILVEIMASSGGQSFPCPGTLVGPFPSGAPAIFIDQVARLGHPCGMIGCVGDDDFGLVNFERLRADGVDVSAISVHPDAPTGSAFVTYEESGDRTSSSTSCTAPAAISASPRRRTGSCRVPTIFTSWARRCSRPQCIE